MHHRRVLFDGSCRRSEHIPSERSSSRPWRQRIAVRAASPETQTLILLLLGASVGLLVGYAAIFFGWLIDEFQALALRTHEPPPGAVEVLPWWWRLLAPALGGLIVGPVVYRWASEARGHGVPEVMEAVHKREGVIRPRVAGAKAFASAVTIGSGGSAGREGPVVQIGAALGSLLGQVPYVSREHRRTLVGCGAAAGIAATFNAPIAGAFFALEVILANFAISAFSPIVLASVVATAVSRAYLGNFPAFVVPDHMIGSWVELVPCGILGIACAGVSVAFVKGLYAIEDAFDRSPIPPMVRPAVGGLLVGLLLLVSPHLYGTGFESIGALLQGELSWTLAAGLVLLKPLACSLTLGSGGSGGVFSPSLFIGAALGYAFGALAQTAMPGWITTPEAYALVGMGAVLSAATHAPVASILILFELTGDYAIILPLMLAVTISTVGARLLDRDSVYLKKLRRRGVTLFGSRDDIVMNTYRVRDVMHRDLPTVPATASFAAVLDRFLTSVLDELYVVDAQGKLLGVISLHDVKGLVGDDSLRGLVIASDFVNPSVPTADPSDTLSECLQTFAATGRESLPVVTDGGDRVPVGLITQRDLIDLYDREVLRREMLGTYAPGEEDHAPLPLGHRLQEIAIPMVWSGRTLRDLGLRQRTGITVLGIHPRDQVDRSLPADPDRLLKAGDRLVVFADHESVAALERLVREEGR